MRQLLLSLGFILILTGKVLPAFADEVSEKGIEILRLLNVHGYYNTALGIDAYEREQGKVWIFVGVKEKPLKNPEAELERKALSYISQDLIVRGVRILNGPEEGRTQLNVFTGPCD